MEMICTTTLTLVHGTDVPSNKWMGSVMIIRRLEVRREAVQD